MLQSATVNVFGGSLTRLRAGLRHFSMGAHGKIRDTVSDFPCEEERRIDMPVSGATPDGVKQLRKS